MNWLRKEREPLPRPAVVAALGAFVCVVVTCSMTWTVADSTAGPRLIMIHALLFAAIGLFGASAFWFSASALFAGLGVVVLAPDNLAVVVVASALLLAALQLFDASRVLRRAPDVDTGFIAGRLLTNAGLAVCGAVITVIVTIVAQSRTWAAVLIPVGVATVSAGLLITWVLIRRDNRATSAARLARATSHFQPPPPSPVARPVSFDAPPDSRP